LIQQLASKRLHRRFFAVHIEFTRFAHNALQHFGTVFWLTVQQYGNLMDTTRVGFAGHSYGAGATPEMTRRAVTAGLGRERFVYVCNGCVV
jgi:surfactin synthase thioesterase subunit